MKAGTTIDLYTATPDEIIKASKFFQGVPENNRSNAGIDCYIDEAHNSSYNGCRIVRDFHAARGYYWNITQFVQNPVNNSHVLTQVLTNNLTKDIGSAFETAGLTACPQCGKPLYSNGRIHQFSKCISTYDRLRYGVYSIKESIRMGWCRFKSNYNR